MIFKPICFLYVFFLQQQQKNITRRTTIWKDRIIVHDIENNPFWCVFLQQQQQKMGIQPGNRYQLTERQNRERQNNT